MNAGIRYVFGIRQSDHITPYRSSLCWPTIDKRREYFMVSLLYRLFTTKKLSYLENRYIINNTWRSVRSNRPQDTAFQIWISGKLFLCKIFILLEFLTAWRKAQPEFSKNELMLTFSFLELDQLHFWELLSNLTWRSMTET